MSDPRPREILHADMDAFYAAIEQRDDPELRGKPVIVGGAGKRGVVSTASYEAREFGVHSAMPGAEARRRCPEGIFVAPRMEVYAAVSAQVEEVFQRYTPLVEPLSLDEAFLDVSGSTALFGDGPTIAARIRRDVFEATQLTISIGVATSKFVAKVASDLDKPDGLVVVEAGREREFLAPLPIRRLWGAGKVTQGKLQQLGFRTIGDLQSRSRDELVALLGEHSGDRFWRLANARDPRRVHAEREAKSISHECTFGDDLTDAETCRRVLLDQSERVGRRLRRSGQRGRIVKLKLRFPPFETLSRQATLGAATDDDLVIYRAAVALFERARGDRPVRLLGVGVSGLADAAEPRQGALFDDAGGSQVGASSDDLLRAMDAIRDRFGEGAIRHGRVDAESDRTPHDE